MKHIPFEIVRAQAQDAVALLDYLKIVGGETENLSFGAEGVPLGVEMDWFCVFYLKGEKDGN